VIVVDASAMLEILLNTPLARVVFDEVFASGQTIQAPHLMDVEVLQVLAAMHSRIPSAPAALRKH
jgi:predicted nucleic acid-binding protein